MYYICISKTAKKMKTENTRLLLAGMAMQGMLANANEDLTYTDENKMIYDALKLTDLLIAQESATASPDKDNIEMRWDIITRLKAENENLQNAIAANGINVGKI